MSEVDMTNAPDFISVPLGEIGYIEMGQSPDSKYVIDDPFVGHPFLQGNAEFGAVFPEPKYGCLRPAKLCKANDVLISVRAPVGAVNLADRDYCIGRGLAAIRVKDIKPSLVGEVIARQSSALRRLSQGTTFEAINKSDLLTLSLKLPPKDEWKYVVEILDTLDTAIQTTEAIVAKLKAVKQGLLHDLLTRGIDASGELRPPQAEAPHLYKPSPLGWIPKEWEIDSILNLTVSSVIGPFGSDLVASDYRASGVPVIFVRDVKQDRLLWKSNVYVSASKANALAAHEVLAGDVVATKMGLPPCVAAVYPSSMPSGIVTADIVRLRPNVSRIRSNWMSSFINSPAVTKQVEQITAGVTRPKVTLRDVRNLHLAVPSLQEQQLILDRVSSMESRVQLEEAVLEKLLTEKAGLMDDLLTGRVRVTPLLEAAAP